MEQEVTIVIKRDYRWENGRNTMQPSADPILAVFAVQEEAEAYARQMAWEEEQRGPLDFIMTEERHPAISMVRFFLSYRDQLTTVYDVITKKVRP